MNQKAHRCTDRCVCPIHAAALLYWPAGDDHACQVAECVHAQGFKAVNLPPTERAVLDTQAILMWRHHPDIQSLGRDA